MATWLLILNDGGHPLFSRSLGLGDTPPFATVGLLSAVHSSASQSGFDLKRIVSGDCTAGFKVYGGGLIVVLCTAKVSNALSDRQLEAALDAIYDALALRIGKSVLSTCSQRNRVKAIQRQIRACSSVLNLYLDSAYRCCTSATGSSQKQSPSSSTSKPGLAPKPTYSDVALPSPAPNASSSSLTHGRSLSDPSVARLADVFLPEVVVPSEDAGKLHRMLQLFSSHTSVSHVALYSSHRLVAGTPQWHELRSRDKFAISQYLRSLRPARCRDLPVHLPHSSLDDPEAKEVECGTTLYRLLTVALYGQSHSNLQSSAMELVMLCDALEPSVSGALKMVERLVHDSQDVREFLAVCRTTLPRHLPQSLTFHPDISGFIYVRGDKTVLSSCFPSPSSVGSSFFAASLSAQHTELDVASVPASLPPPTDDTKDGADPGPSASATPTAADASTLLRKLAMLCLFFHSTYATLCEESKPRSGVSSWCSQTYLRLQAGGLYAIRRQRSVQPPPDPKAKKNQQPKPIVLLNTIFVLFGPRVPFRRYRGLSTGLLDRLDTLMDNTERPWRWPALAPA